MARNFGSKNRLKLPEATAIIKFASHTLQDSLVFLDEVIASRSADISIKNKMDAVDRVLKLLDMAGYGKELEAGSRQLHNLKGETNPYREEKDITPIKPQIEPDAKTDEKPKEKEGLISRYVESQSIQ